MSVVSLATEEISSALQSGMIDTLATVPTALKAYGQGLSARKFTTRAQLLRRSLALAPVHDDARARVEHAAGKGLPDLLRLRAGDATPAPDAVVAPASHEAVRALLAACAEHRVAVVPFGGGTSVVGGVEPLRGDCHAVVALNLSALREAAVDRRSLLASGSRPKSGAWPLTLSATLMTPW